MDLFRVVTFLLILVCVLVVGFGVYEIIDWIYNIIS